MEKLNERRQSSEAALTTLAEALVLAYSVIVRNAAIHRDAVFSEANCGTNRKSK